MAKTPPQSFSRGPRVRASQAPAPVVSKVEITLCGGRWQARSVVGDTLIREFDSRVDGELYRDAFNSFCTPDGHSVYGKVC